MHQDNDSLDGEEELIYPVEANDVFNPTEVKTIWDKLNEITPLEAWQIWPSKTSTRKDSVKNEPRYGGYCNPVLIKTRVNYIMNHANSIFRAPL